MITLHHNRAKKFHDSPLVNLLIKLHCYALLHVYSSHRSTVVHFLSKLNWNYYWLYHQRSSAVRTLQGPWLIRQCWYVVGPTTCLRLCRKALMSEHVTQKSAHLGAKFFLVVSVQVAPNLSPSLMEVHHVYHSSQWRIQEYFVGGGGGGGGGRERCSRYVMSVV